MIVPPCVIQDGTAESILSGIQAKIPISIPGFGVGEHKWVSFSSDTYQPGHM